MKRITLIFVLTTISFFSNAQSFEKGTFVIDTKINLAIYETTVKIVDDNGNALSDDDGAASFVPQVIFEYGVSNMLGLGAKVQLNNYIEGDSSNVETAKSIELAGVLNLHIIRNEKFNLLLGFNAGLSSFNLNGIDNTSGNAYGTHLDFNIESRFYLSKHFGLNINVGYARFNYVNGKLENEIGTNYDLDFKAKGVNFGAGIILKF